MIKMYHKWRDRRHGSKRMPLYYLLTEFILYTLIAWFVFMVAPLWLFIVAGVGLLYFFLTNSLKRYHKVKERQQFYEAE